jgi:hypothetical protein
LSSTNQRGCNVARSPHTLRQIERGGVHDAESLGNRGRHERGIPNGGQPDEQHTNFALGRDRAPELQRQTRLAGSSRPGERDETCSGIREPRAQRLHFTVAAQKRGESQGQRHAAQFIARCVVISRARARNESVTGRTGQVECSRQRPHGLDMRSTSLPTLQRAHRMNRQA